ncbi:MAG: sulfatase [Myxococcales bacterium]|nr:sulfatase-like hydrolase/transferase [Polyangiaceae bacterium]MDW8247865.1 sulfatase [Myxococcales bacterium]
MSPRRWTAQANDLLDARPALGFLALASVDACILAARAVSPSPRVLLVSILYSTALACALGGVFSLILSLATHPDRRLRTALLLLVLLTGWWILRNDVAPRARKLPLLPATLWSPLLAAALMLPTGALLYAAAPPYFARKGEKPGVRSLLLLAAALALQLANHRYLPGNYPGVHLLVLAFSGVLLTLAIPRCSRGNLPLLLTGLGSALLVAKIPAPRAVRSELNRHAGVALAPWVFEFHARRTTSHGRLRAIPLPPNRPPTPGGLGIRNPVVVLLTVDGMRHDVLDTHGSWLPHMTRLRAESLDFRQARTTAPATHVALATLLASRYFSSLRWVPGPPGEDWVPATDEVPRFTTQLQQSGIPTVSVISGDWMRPDWRILEGFSEALDSPREGSLTPARVVAERACARLRAHQEGSLLLHAHFLDAHAPYDLGGTDGNERERYARELALVDKAIGIILETIREAPWADRAIVLLTADHGEAFGEHGYLYHATMLYDEVLRVPFLLKIPGQAPRKMDTPITLLDIGPTLLDLWGQVIPGPMEGISLIPLIQGKIMPPRVIAADSGRHQRAMIFPDGHKVIHDRRRDLAELYDLIRDPGETRNLYDNEPLTTPHLDELQRFFDERTLEPPPFRPP